MVDLSIIIPIFNEQSTIGEIIRRVLGAQSLQEKRLQIILVDDASTDGTGDVLAQSPWKHDPRFLFLRHEKNRGKGAAIRTAIPHATGEYTIIQDADLEYDPEDIGKLFANAKKNNLEALFGSRNLSVENRRGTPGFYWGGRLVTAVANVLFRQTLSDEPTCYKLMKTKLLQSFSLRAERFDFCPEVTACLAKQGIKIPEISINYYPRGKKEGKKIIWRDGVSALITLFHYRFVTKKIWLITLGIMTFSFLLYLSTWQATFGGYEGETARAAVSVSRGIYLPTRAGLGAQILYLPFVFSLSFFSDKFLFYCLTLVPLIYSAIGIGCIFLIVHELYKKISISIATTVLIAVGTMIWPYTNIGMEYQAFFYLTLLLYGLLRWKRANTSLFFPAVIMGLVIMAKSYGMLFGLGYLGFVGSVLWRGGNWELLRQKKFWWQFLGIPALFFLANITLLFFSRGSVVGTYSLAHEFQVWTWWEGIYGVLFSAGKGIFFYCPLLFVAIFYFRDFAKRYPETAVFIFSMFMALFLVTAPFSYWSDETWSVRKFVPIIPFLHVPLGLWFGKRWRWWEKSTMGVLVILAIYIQFLGAVYPYGRQLLILRQVNMDSLQSMRFIPEASHIPLYHQLFLSYVISPQIFSYTESSWFRWTEGKPDMVFRDTRLNLHPYKQPAITWWEEGVRWKTITYHVVVFGSWVLLLLIINEYWYCRVREETV